MNRLVARHPWIPYVVPYAAFMVLLALVPRLALPLLPGALIRNGVPTLLVLLFALPALRVRISRPAAAVGIGILVFVIWIGPDQLLPGYRTLGIFQNAVVGRLESSVPPEARSDALLLAIRAFRGVILVPVVEELFWRGWVSRWIDAMDDFRAVPLGRFTTLSFTTTAVLFGLEHGSYWDVGIAAGAVYNWWMIRTKSLGDLIVCHAVTNACLAGWVLATGQWQYW